MRTNLKSKFLRLLLAGSCLFATVGCQSYGPINLTPAKDVLNASCCLADTDTAINFLALRQTPPGQYVLDKGDILGIYIQGITGDIEVPPPVNFTGEGEADPGLGYPVEVRADGSISLPLVDPIRVSGLTMVEAERKIVAAYTSDNKILLDGSEKIFVSLMKRRTYNILVVREDISNGTQRTSLTGSTVCSDEEAPSASFSIELPAYENDVLHALSETGGMPGERARNEIVILRGIQNYGPQQSLIRAVGAPMMVGVSPTIDGANTTVIPIKGPPEAFPIITEQDITLNDGDVVYIRGREQEVFYTGGLLDGGRLALPRDYEIDVLEAIAIARGSATGCGGSVSASGFRTGGVKPATQVTIIRKCGCEQVTIDVDLRYAISDPSERVIIQPGDMIILEYRHCELVANSMARILQFGGIFNAFR